VESDHLIQRFGRLNRFGTTKGEAHLVYTTPIEDRLVSTLKYLRSLGSDISCHNIWENQPPEEACSERPACARLEERLVDAWAQTTYRDYQMPNPVSPWLNGKEDSYPETELAWREDVSLLAGWRIGSDQIEDVLELYPVRPHERLREPTQRVLNKLAKLVATLGEEAARIDTIQVESDGSAKVRRLTEVVQFGGLEYRLLILPDKVGRLERGMFQAEKSVDGVNLDVADWGSVRRRFSVTTNTWTPLGGRDRTEPFEREVTRRSLAEFADDNNQRFPLVVREPEGERLLLYFSEAPQGKPKPHDVLLSQHQPAVARKARALIEQLGLASLADSFSSAGLKHDQGKHRELWQRAFGGCMDAPIAKSKAPINLRLLDGYRHELGSLVDSELDSDDLVLHLIASHHKSARRASGVALILDIDLKLREQPSVADEVSIL
jgi:CRISPR-associated endonuclease/helicase Cas3